LDFITVASNDLATLSGTVLVANGGTGLSSLTLNNVMLGNGTSAVQFVAPGATGNVLTSNGTTWTSAVGVSLASNNAFTGANSFYNASGQNFGTATSTQDGVVIAGRAGGSSSFRVTLQPDTLTLNRTLTLPDNSGTVLTSGAAVTIAQGGTNSTATPSAGAVPYGTGTAYSFNAPGSLGQVLVSNGSSAPSWGSSIVSGTSQASTSGTYIDFTGIPSWAKRVTVMFAGVKVNATGNFIIQIGNGSLINTGYVSLSGDTSGNKVQSIIGFICSYGNGSSNTNSGAIVITQLSPNIWSYASTLTDYANTSAYIGGGYLPLSGSIDRLRVTTVTATPVFNAGNINILYE
jgi:hypothetical protein